MTIHTRPGRRARRTLLGALIYGLLASAVAADTLHNIGNGDFQHHDSGWIFPERIGEFTRIGAPQDVDGTIDVVAHYARVHNGTRTSAIIDVYPTTSSAPSARYEDALAEMSSDTNSIETSRVHVQGSLRLTASKDESAANVLYFVDTGPWIIKIRAHTERAEDDATDAFVRQQRWDTLTLTPADCIGPACGSTAAAVQ
ncbi:MAG TPA: hypothetical protein VNA21_06500 [Steroidobacteraceae bacterium]|nr:hypothetical protein [Steroidobacteraceae bacterium]